MPTRLVRAVVAGTLSIVLAAGSATWSSTEAHAAATASYIGSVLGAARASQARYGVPVSVSIAQSILESGWGRSGLTTRWRNYFGIKCAATRSPHQSGCAALESAEYLGGWTTRVSRFRTYASMTGSFLDHGRLLSRADRYRAAFAHRGDPEAFVRAVARAGYATDPSYASLVISLIRRYRLDRYDLPPTTRTPPSTAKVSKADRRRFLAVVTPIARAQQARYGIPASVTIAQAISASNWGRSRLAVTARNYFGVRCPVKAKACVTVKGVKYQRYPSLTASFAHRARLLTGARYADALAGDAVTYLTRLVARGWTADRRHPATILKVIRAHGLQRLDHGFATVRRGDSGPRVAAVQRLLTAAGHKVPATGNYRSLTESAVRAFQARHELPVTGEAGQRTLARLVRIVRLGDRGLRVAALNGLLRGLDPTAASSFGKATKAAVRRVEAKAGLPVDGVADLLVWIALLD